LGREQIKVSDESTKPGSMADCHGQFDGLVCCSDAKNWSLVTRFLWRLRLAVLHTNWHIRTKGLLGMTKHIVSKLLAVFGLGKKRGDSGSDKSAAISAEDVLNLKPGEWIEVKSEQEILATLDQKGRYKGLGWMCNMRKFCGKRYRVFKRLETMLLESNRQYRKVKDTVLLEGVMCDGEEWYGCDRSCFHFWREVWLKRAPSPQLSTEKDVH
jgi:hypothetical protein